MSKKNTEKRNIVHDTHASGLTSEDSKQSPSMQFGDRGNTLALPKADFRRLMKLFQQLQVALRSGKTIGFHFNKAGYEFLSKESRIVLSDEPDVATYAKADLMFCKSNDAARWIRVTYSLYMNGNEPVLGFIGNPTTIVAGSNIRPIRIDDVTAFQETLSFYQLGFRLLEFIFERQKFEWSKLVQKRIRGGLISVSNTQWAAYLHTPHKTEVLNFIDAIYTSKLGHHKGNYQLAEYLGFQQCGTWKNDKGEVSGVFMMKKRGTNKVLVINFYDKRQSVANKKQGLALSTAETELVNNSIRLDITAHGPFLESMLSAARSQAKLLIQYRPELRTRLKKLTAVKPNTPMNAYRLCRIMSILAIEIRDGQLYKGTFADWLLKRVLGEEIHLYALMQNRHLYQNPKGKTDLDKEIFMLWKMMKNSWKRTFSDYMVEHFPGNNSRWAQRQLNRIEYEYNLDLNIPYRYFDDEDRAMNEYGLDSEDKLLLRDSKNKSSAEQLKIELKMRRKNERFLKRERQRVLDTFELTATQIPADPLYLKSLEG